MVQFESIARVVFPPSLVGVPYQDSSFRCVHKRCDADSLVAASLRFCEPEQQNRNKETGDKPVNIFIHPVVLQKRDDFVDAPNVIAHACFHCGRHSQCLVNPAKIVVHIMQRDGVFQVLQLFGKGVGQSRE